MPDPIRVFISYSHDSVAHLERVRELAGRLRASGVDAWIDRFSPAPTEGWPRWTQRQMAEARFVLVVCTGAYAERFNRPPGQGSGVGWEASFIRQELYRQGGNARFIPVFFEDDRAVPEELQPYQRYQLPDDYLALLRHVTGQPEVQVPGLGAPPALPPLPEAQTIWSEPRLKIFVAHAPADAAAAGRIAGQLQRAGLTVLPTHSEGESRVDWLMHGLQHASYILLLCSRAARVDPLIERGWKAALEARQDAVLLPIRLEPGAEVPLLLRDRGFDCATSFEGGLERLVRFFDRERASPAPLVHGLTPLLSSSSREELRLLALASLDKSAFGAFLEEAGLAGGELGREMGEQLVTLLHDGDYEGSMELFLEFLEEHGDQVTRRLSELRARPPA